MLVLAGCVFLVLACFGTTAMAQEKDIEEMTMDEVFSMSLDDLLKVTTTTATGRETPNQQSTSNDDADHGSKDQEKGGSRP